MSTRSIWKLRMIDFLTVEGSVLASATVSGAVSVSIIYLARFTITERIRGAIKSEFDIKLLEQAHRYELLAAEHSLKLEKLQEKRVAIVEETYGELREIYFMTSRFMQYDEKADVNDDKINHGFNEILEKWQTFMFQFERKRIYLPRATCDSIESISDDIGISALEYAHSAKIPYGAFEKTLTRSQVVVVLRKYAERLEEQIKPAMYELEDELRKLIGSQT